MTLARQVQRDWSGGQFSTPARELIPENGFADCINGLLEEDGTVFRRGGGAYKTTVDAPANLTFLWDGYVSAGQRTVVGTASNFYVLDTDDQTLVTLGGNGTDGRRPASGDGLVFIPCGASASTTLAIYGGSRKTAAYTTGSVTVTSGSQTVTGSGTTWSTNVDVGMVFVTAAFASVVTAVNSNTSITVRDFPTATQTGVTYSLSHIATSNIGSTVDAVATISAPARVVVATGSKIKFSGAGTWNTFAATDYHQLPSGATVLGMEALGHVLMVFSTAGVFAISGMDYDLTDAYGNVQQRISQLSRDVILLDQRGITGWHGALVVPATDDIYLMTDTAAPQSVSAEIRKKYRDYVKAGYTCGFTTVYRNHLFVPILNGGTWVDTLVCRLDAGGWTRWDGHSGTSVGFTTRSTSGAPTPKLLSASGKRVLNLSDCFNPTGSNKNDADGTTHQFSLITRDYTTGGLNKNLVKKIRFRYELTDAASDSPTLTAYYSTGAVNSSNPSWGASTWGAFQWGASSVEQFAQIDTGTAPTSTGSDPYVWPVRTTESGVRPRFARFKFLSTSPCATLRVKSLEVFIRQGGRQ